VTQVVRRAAVWMAHGVDQLALRRMTRRLRPSFLQLLLQDGWRGQDVLPGQDQVLALQGVRRDKVA
jgi:hypothetical protein